MHPVVRHGGAKRLHVSDRPPKFLSVACYEQFITVQQAIRIYREQHRIRQLMPSDRTSCGEIAVDLKILTPAAVDAIRVRARELGDTPEDVPDVIADTTRKLSEQAADAITKTGFLLQLSIAALAAKWRDLETAATWAFGIALGMVVLQVWSHFWARATQGGWRLFFKVSPFLVFACLIAILVAFEASAPASPADLDVPARWVSERFAATAVQIDLDKARFGGPSC